MTPKDRLSELELERLETLELLRIRAAAHKTLREQREAVDKLADRMKRAES